MYHVSAQDVDECMINVHYYYHLTITSKCLIHYYHDMRIPPKVGGDIGKDKPTLTITSKCLVHYCHDMRTPPEMGGEFREAMMQKLNEPRMWKACRKAEFLDVGEAFKLSLRASKLSACTTYYRISLRLNL